MAGLQKALAGLFVFRFFGLALAGYPSEGCFWTGNCVNGWAGGCGENRVAVSKSQNCAGLCPAPQYPTCPIFTTHFQCCNKNEPRVSTICSSCERRVDFGKAFICCEDCSEPIISNKDSGEGFCMTGARLALSFKPVEVFKWDVGRWGNCSSSCGGGVRKRQVSCRQFDFVSGQLSGAVLDAEKCDEPPISEEACNLKACPTVKAKNAQSRHRQEDKAHHHMSGWLVAFIVIVSMGAVTAMAVGGYMYYQRYQSNNEGFVYVMLEGYN